MTPKATTPGQALRNAIQAAENAERANQGSTSVSMERAENYTRIGHLWVQIAREMAEQAAPAERVTVE